MKPLDGTLRKCEYLLILLPPSYTLAKTACNHTVERVLGLNNAVKFGRAPCEERTEAYAHTMVPS